MALTDVSALPDYAPVPKSALGPAVNEQGYYVGRVDRNLYWVTEGVYQCAFLTTPDGVVLFDAPPTIGHNIQRAIDEIAGANGLTNQVTHLVHSHHHADHVGCLFTFRQHRRSHRTRGDATAVVARQRSGPPGTGGDLPRSPHTRDRR